MLSVHLNHSTINIIFQRFLLICNNFCKIYQRKNAVKQFYVNKYDLFNFPYTLEREQPVDYLAYDVVFFDTSER